MSNPTRRAARDAGAPVPAPGETPVAHSAASLGEAGAPPPEENSLRRRAFVFEYVTIGWNIVEGFASVAVGLAAGSIALVAYGLDSMVEVFASAVVVWELRGVTRERERLALRLIGLAYAVVGVYVMAEAVRSLVSGHHASASPVGIGLTSATVLVMVALSAAKRRIGALLASATVLADATFSLVDAGLAATVLTGLVLNAALGWWWSDQLLAMVLALVALREGAGSWRGRE